MSREIDLDLINTKARHRDQLVQDGKFIEATEQDDRTPESIKGKAKEILGIGPDDLIMLEFESRLASQNKKTKAFVSLNNFITKVEDTGLLTEEESVNLKGIEDRLSGIISEMYDIDIEDLYTKGDF